MKPNFDPLQNPTDAEIDMLKVESIGISAVQLIQVFVSVHYPFKDHRRRKLRYSNLSQQANTILKFFPVLESKTGQKLFGPNHYRTCCPV